MVKAYEWLNDGWQSPEDALEVLGEILSSGQGGFGDWHAKAVAEWAEEIPAEHKQAVWQLYLDDLTAGASCEGSQIDLDAVRAVKKGLLGTDNVKVTIK